MLTQKYFNFFPSGRILKHNWYFYFNPLNSEEKNKVSDNFASLTMLQSVAWFSFFNPVTVKRKMKLSDNFASLTMLQSVAWFSFSVFGASLKIENLKWRSIFVFRPKHSKSLTVLPKRREKESICTVNFYLQPPLPRSASLPRGLGRKWEFNCLFEVFHDVLERLVCFCPSVMSITVSSQTLDVS